VQGRHREYSGKRTGPQRDWRAGSKPARQWWRRSLARSAPGGVPEGTVDAEPGVDEVLAVLHRDPPVAVLRVPHQPEGLVALRPLVDVAEHALVLEPPLRVGRVAQLLDLVRVRGEQVRLVAAAQPQAVDRDRALLLAVEHADALGLVGAGEAVYPLDRKSGV